MSAVHLAAADAIALIEDGQTVALSGAGGGLLEPDLLIAELGRAFERRGRPRGLTLVHAFGLGDRAERGLAPIARPGLVRRAIAGHWGQSPAMARMATAGEIEAYNLPLGVMTQLFREIAGGRAGLLTTTGLGTFADPRVEGGRMNASTREQLVEVVRLGGREQLLYRAWPIDVALLRGWEADETGAVSLVGEPARLDTFALASAVRASGGRVIVQVKRVLGAGERLAPADVTLPAMLVDALVEHPHQQQTYESEFNGAYAGLERVAHGDRPPLALGPRKVIARRAAQLLRPGMVAAVGVGIPDGVPAVLAEEGVADAITLTVEHGVVGGVTQLGALFGVSTNFEAILDTPDMIDFFHAGGLDAAVLGFAEMERRGDVNVSKFDGYVMGSGGFVDISQSARTVVFAGTLTAGGFAGEVADGRLRIVREGARRKLVERVEQITFSGLQALARGHETHLVTERAVFELRAQGLTVTEVAPGVDLERDVLGRMDFAPAVAPDLREMDAALFAPAPFGLARVWRPVAVDG